MEVHDEWKQQEPACNQSQSPLDPFLGKTVIRSSFHQIFVLRPTALRLCHPPAPPRLSLSRRRDRRRRTLFAVASTAASTATASPRRLPPLLRLSSPHARLCHGFADADALPRSALSRHCVSSRRASAPPCPASSRRSALAAAVALPHSA